MANRNNAEFKKIYTENLPLVSHVVRMFPSLSNDADDIIHDVFLNLFQKMETTEISNVRGYLSVAARNSCLTRLTRKKTRKTDFLEQDEDFPQDKMWESDTDHELNLQLIGELIEEMKNEIPGGPEFYMFYKEGLSLREIVEKTGDPMGTVAARIARLRERMKKSIRDRMDEFH